MQQNSLHGTHFTGKVFISTPEDTGPAHTQMKLQHFTGKVSFRHPRTPDRSTQRNFNTARGPLDPLTTAVLDQPPGRAA